jgi:hypothetical protein
MPNHDVINQIRDSISDINNGLLYRQIVPPEMLYVLSDFLGKGESAYQYLNVPLKSIVALSREHDTWYRGDNWKDVVIERLHGDDWPEEVFDYFESDIGDKPFPTSSTRLELTCYGGVITCSNGNHRLPANISWLLSHNIRHLKHVRTNMVPLDTEALETLKSFFTRRPQCIDLCIDLNTWGNSFFDSAKLIKANGIYYSFTKNSIEEIHSQSPPIFNKIKRTLFDDDFDEKTRALDSQNWVHIPEHLLQLLFEQDTWFQSNFQNQHIQQI